MKNTLLAGILVCVVTVAGYSQGKNNSLSGVPFKERIVTGGGFGLSFGNQQDVISLSPILGYKLTERFMLGTGVSYRYTKFKYYKPAITLKDYGINPFARFMIQKGFFVQMEYEYLNYEFPATATESTRKTFSSVFAGGGLIQPLGGKTYLFIMALYNLSYTEPAPGEYTPYQSPFVLRAGINIGNFSF